MRSKVLPAALRRTKFGNYELIQPIPYAAMTQSVPEGIIAPDYDIPSANHVHINDREDISKLSKSCKLAKQVLDFACQQVGVGITTEEIDDLVFKEIIRNGAYPSPLGYKGFPRSICTSVNNVICHGIPDKRPLKDGDILNIDVTVFLDGFHGDTSRMVQVGQVDEKGIALDQHTKEALEKAISVCKHGVPFKRIGSVIHEIAKKYGYSINNAFCGHGIGKSFHQPPFILHDLNDYPGFMEAGMSFTIEPIFCQGTSNYLKWPDGWTIVTVDGSRAAQYEHTILIENDGAKILTL